MGNDPFNYVAGKSVDVNIYNTATQKCDLVETRELTLGSQLKQHAVKQVQKDICNLAKKKAKGGKVGRLQFYKEVNSVTLAQYGVTYTQCSNPNYFKLQKVGKVKVHGIEQLQRFGTYEFAEAKLIRRPSGYYLKVLIYIPKEASVVVKGASCGIDLGIKDELSVVDQDNCITKFNTTTELPTRLKRLCRNVSKKQKGSRNNWSENSKRRKAYERYVNVKEDKAKKIVCRLKAYESIYVQDDSIKGWQMLYGRKVATGSRGKIKAELKKLESCVLVPKFAPTTAECPWCLISSHQPLAQRFFLCPECGYFEKDRDGKGGKCIEAHGKYIKAYGLTQYKAVVMSCYKQGKNRKLKNNGSKTLEFGTGTTSNTERIGLSAVALHGFTEGKFEALTAVYTGYNYEGDCTVGVDKLEPVKQNTLSAWEAPG